MIDETRRVLLALRNILRNCVWEINDPEVRRTATEALDELLDAPRAHAGEILIDGVPRIGSAPARTLLIRARMFAELKGRVRHPRSASDPTHLVLEGGATLDVHDLLDCFTTHEDGNDGDIGDGERVTFLLVLHPYNAEPGTGAP